MDKTAISPLRDGRGTDVRRSPDGANSPGNARAEEIALALIRVGVRPETALAEAASRERPQGAVTGRAAIRAAGCAPTAGVIRIDQVVTHGRAGSVSGRVMHGTTTRLFCHVIRFTAAATGQIAQVVSFEHRSR